ncbi:Putative DSBA-like thioredoxin domain, HCCA isomerase/glutathione S-transferase kappa [Septoria linicola]|uniref:Glutathione S-transferase kappa n=1 Tax=Septoria linicola TaxID=215465 RepID=A0A9Q9EPD7_9PEZI|nr:Putative DSBA-like thioredoxin domain, HCCA isomerase/glutathione S-transferase kappa [Septoria linicola]
MSQQSGKKLTLYVDVISPFAYMAYWLTRNSPVFTHSNIQITYIPILLGGVIITNKKDWINLERTRTAKTLRIPIVDTVPQPFPQATTNTQRALCHIYATKSQTELIKALDALYTAFWQKGLTPINDVKNIGKALKEGGFSEEEVKEILDGVKGDVAKKVLRENSDAAFDDGCFGLPWFVATNEAGDKQSFWGVDHVGQVLEHLGVEVKGENGRYRSML